MSVRDTSTGVVSVSVCESVRARAVFVCVGIGCEDCGLPRRGRGRRVGRGGGSSEFGKPLIEQWRGLGLGTVGTGEGRGVEP